jgi:mannose-6-phosphate isomerase-like protein (cupin superfamily)
MSDFTIKRIADVPDAFGGKWPGSMHFLGGPLEADQLAVTYRAMPPGAGGKGGYGHRHRTQEEIFVVLSGTLQFKLEDEVIDVVGPAAVRIAPHVARSVYNEGPDDAALLICSTRLREEDAEGEAEIVPDFWPA